MSLVLISYQALAATAKGPLSVLMSNPRCFTDGSGKAVYLTGSHTWANQQDRGIQKPPPVYDFDAYLDFLQEHNHNFIRLRRKELTRYAFEGFFKSQLIYGGGPQPWLRTGPGMALDGQPKFDLNQFNPASGLVASRGSFVATPGHKTFRAPFSGDAILYLVGRTPSPPGQKLRAP
jgi:hypothetical protein